MYEPAVFIKTFVTDLDAALSKLKPNAKLTQLQRMWLGFCLMGILLTNSVCWAKFERASLGSYKIAALSWMFRESKVSWEYLLLASVTLVLERHGITEGVWQTHERERFGYPGIDSFPKMPSCWMRLLWIRLQKV